jgi:hypothetical protein
VEWEPRLNRVRVSTHDGEFDLDWNEREELIATLSAVPGSESVIERFRAVGATRPVELTDEQKALVASTIDAGRGLGEALHELREAFVDDLDRRAA